MDPTFDEQLRQWADVFRALAGPAGALLGLSFVMMSLRKEIIDRPEVADVRAYAVMIFGNFFTVLVVALLGLAPGMSAATFGLSLGILGVLGCGWLVHLAWLSYRLQVAAEPPARWRYINYGTILAAYAGLAVIGVALGRGHTQALDWLLPAVIAQLALGVFGNWVLLIHANLSHAERAGRS